MKLGQGKYLANADMTVGEIFERMDYEPEEDLDELEYKRASEWAFEQLGRVPSVGESFRYGALTVAVARMRANRIVQLSLALPEAVSDVGGVSA